MLYVYWRRSRETAAPRKKSTFRLVSPMFSFFFWICNAYRTRSVKQTKGTTHTRSGGPAGRGDKWQRNNWNPSLRGIGSPERIFWPIFVHIKAPRDAKKPPFGDTFEAGWGEKGGSGREAKSDVQKGPARISIWGPRAPTKGSQERPRCRFWKPKLNYFLVSILDTILSAI